MKPKKCPVCKESFTPARPLQKVCGFECSLQLSMQKREKAERIAQAEERKIIKIKKEKLKTKSDHANELQTIFNAYIRERDRDLPCISCGRHHQGQYHAGHYRTVGAHPELRFEELNVHRQCSVCNNHKSGNIVEYRLNLVKKIGLANLSWLEGNHDPKKYTIQELIELKKFYRKKLADLKEQNNLLV